MKDYVDFGARYQIATCSFFAALIMFVVVAVYVAGMHHNKNKSDVGVVMHPVSRGYDQGVNNALICIMLLDLEQKFQGTNRTWGAMADIVRERLGVEKEK